MTLTDGLNNRVESLETIAQGQEARLNLLTIIAERADERLEEQKRYSRNVHRLWINLCRKYGWLEDEWLGDSKET